MSANHPAPGTRGSMQIGLACTNELEREIERLQAKGVKLTRPTTGDGGALAYFTDPDGNALYLWSTR